MKGCREKLKRGRKKEKRDGERPVSPTFFADNNRALMSHNFQFCLGNDI